MVVIVGVSKRWSNRGRDRKNHPRADKRWSIYGYDDFGKFFSRRVNFMEAKLAKLRIIKLQSFLCTGCGFKFRAQKNSKPACPVCGAGEDI